jgi:uncharacterized metal-binding protein
MSDRKVMVIPCSGIGKAFGAISREATYLVVEKLRPERAETACLGRLVMGDEETHRKVQAQPCIAVDGCPAVCSLKNVQLASGNVVGALRVVDIYKEHTEFKPKAVAQVDEAGRCLAEIVAAQVAGMIDGIEEA